MIRLQKILFGLAGAAALLSLGLIWYAVNLSSAPEATQHPFAGHFVLTDQNGHARSNAEYRGRFTLLYFGYTSCPDVCPTTLQQIATALHRLGPKASRVVPIFITVDPDRDTPAILKTYLSAFGPEFVGLTGSRAAVARAAREYGVYFARQPQPGGTYSVTHSSSIYLVDPAGKLADVYDANTDADALARDLKSRL